MKKETSKEKEAKKYLNQRQVRFVQEYMKTNNVRQSAVVAGYSPKTAQAQGGRLLQNVRVQAYIQAINERLDSDKIADIQEVMEYLTSVMRGEKKDQFDLDAALSERTKAASELAKRLDVRARELQVECALRGVDGMRDDGGIEDPEGRADEEESS